MRHTKVYRFVVIFAVATSLIGMNQLRGNDITLVSTTTEGVQGNQQSREPSITADGRYVCFESRAKNLVPHDTNGVWDIFVKDTTTGHIRRVSVSSSGAQANDFSTMNIISADGSAVAFMSAATNLVPDDTNNAWDYFVHDLKSGVTTRVSVSSDGSEGNGGADCDCRVYKFPGISSNGRIITFHSNASNLVPNDTNEVFDVFRHDRLTGETLRVSVSTEGYEADNNCWNRDLSPDGRYVLFHSSASTLVANDTNDHRDIFLHDIQIGVTERVNIPSGGGETDDISDSPKVSADGRFVSFASLATNLVSDDTNGQWDVFLRDRLLGETSLISLSTIGTHGDLFSRHPAISADGRFITFHSVTTNLVPGDTNEVRDIFMRDRFLDETIRISTTYGGAESNDRSYDAFISPNGRWIVFDSAADNLVPDDINDTRDIFLVDRFNTSLTLSPPYPGQCGEMNFWEIHGATPGSTVTLMYSHRYGDGHNIPGCTVDIDILSPATIATVLIEAEGIGYIESQVSEHAKGRRFFFQAVEPINCRKTNVIDCTFE